MAARFKEAANHILATRQDVVSRPSTELQSIEKLLTSDEATSASMAETQASVEKAGCYEEHERKRGND